MISAVIHLANRDYASLVDDFIRLQILPEDSNRPAIIPLMDKALSPYVKGGGAKRYEEEVRRLYGMEEGEDPFSKLHKCLTNLFKYRGDVLQLLSLLDSKLFDTPAIMSSKNMKNKIITTTKTSIKNNKNNKGLLPMIGECDGILLPMIKSYFSQNYCPALKDTSCICRKLLPYVDVLPLQGLNDNNNNNNEVEEGGDFLHEIEWNLYHEKKLLEDDVIPSVRCATQYLRRLVQTYQQPISSCTESIHETIQLLLPLDTFMTQYLQYISIGNNNNNKKSTRTTTTRNAASRSSTAASRQYNNNNDNNNDDMTKSMMKWMIPTKIIQHIDYIVADDNNIDQKKNPFLENYNEDYYNYNDIEPPVLPTIQSLIQDLSYNNNNTTDISCIAEMIVSLENTLGTAFLDNLRILVRHRLKRILQDVKGTHKRWKQSIVPATAATLVLTVSFLVLPEIMAQLYWFFLYYTPRFFTKILLPFLKFILDLGRLS